MRVVINKETVGILGVAEYPCFCLVSGMMAEWPSFCLFHHRHGVALSDYHLHSAEVVDVVFEFSWLAVS